MSAVSSLVGCFLKRSPFWTVRLVYLLAVVLSYCTNDNNMIKGVRAEQVRIDCDSFCMEATGSSYAYCKTWMNTPHCLGSNEPCTPELCVSQVDNNEGVVDANPSHSMKNGPHGWLRGSLKIFHSRPFHEISSSSTEFFTEEEEEVTSPEPAEINTGTEAPTPTADDTTTATEQTESSSEPVSTSTEPPTTVYGAALLFQPSDEPTMPGYDDCPWRDGPDFMWAEWGNIDGNRDAWDAYYTTLLRQVLKSCGTVKRLILRTLDPFFPPNSNGGAGPFWPPQQSSLYEALLSKLPSNVHIYLYPYLLDDFSIEQWNAFSPEGAAIDGTPLGAVFDFAEQWNKFLSSTETSLRITGITIDNEEVRSKNWITSKMISPIKDRYPGLEFAVTIGFDELGLMKKIAPFTDVFFLQAYDFYTRNVAHLARSADPSVNTFLSERDSGSSFAQFVLNSVMTPQTISTYGELGNKILLMWSVQAFSNRDCLVPLSDGSCGINDEFGTWSRDGFFDFLRSIRPLIPSVLEHGVFQFNFMPTSWLV